MSPIPLPHDSTKMGKPYQHSLKTSFVKNASKRNPRTTSLNHCLINKRKPPSS